MFCQKLVRCVLIDRIYGMESAFSRLLDSWGVEQILNLEDLGLEVH